VSEETESDTRGTRKTDDPDSSESGRLDEREQRQHGVQQHGDTFSVDSDAPTDTSGVPRGSNRRPQDDRD
jgi:hypothetical protein